MASGGQPQGGRGGTGPGRVVPSGEPARSGTEPVRRRGELRFCHREESRTTSRAGTPERSIMGGRLLDLPFPERPLADPDDPKVTHNFKRENDKIKVETHAGDKIYQLIVEYAFGTSDQYVTMIGRDEERTYRALRLSSYHTARRRGLGTAPRAMCRTRTRARTSGASRSRCATGWCAACTATSRFIVTFETRRRRRSAPRGADRGIGCERCHGPGGNHLKAINGNFGESAIMNAGTGAHRRSASSVPTATSSGRPPRDQQGARGPAVRPVAGAHVDVQPVLHRERRCDELHDLSRRPSRRPGAGDLSTRRNA